ncbi:unnamed protein product [Rhizoctonia solani]|uniref:Cyclin N-terminal domain-containing protein n=1 Tax=Rhizoctonia solani TaxID=456999 RepID=A0A8H2ZZJ9_9AGAM|nr:unnamed protein product [Rhizoctonia solani]
MPPPITYRSTRTHPSSLIPASEHNSDLLWLMGQRVNADMVDYIVGKVREVVPHCCDTCHPPTSYKRTDTFSTLPSPPVTPIKPAFQNGSVRRNEHEAPLPALEDFLGNIASSSKIQAPTLLCTLIYLNRILPKLPPIDKNAPHSRSPDVQHRVLMATIICAAKYLNDSSPKNKHWALYSYGLLTCQDINAMEQQLLALLDWDLRLTEEECIGAFSVFFGKSGPCSTNQPTTPPKDAATRGNPSNETFSSNPSAHLSVPSNRRASRPAKIEISTGPAHLHSSFTHSKKSNGPLSPPRSAASATFNECQEVLTTSDQTKQSNGEDSAKSAGYMRTQGARYSIGTQVPRINALAHGSSSHPSVRFAADPIIPSSDATGNNQEPVPSWHTLTRANGILERVWGNNHYGRSGIRSSRSVGALFRAANPDNLAERATARV